MLYLIFYIFLLKLIYNIIQINNKPNIRVNKLEKYILKNIFNINTINNKIIYGIKLKNYLDLKNT
jgi:hypothetical protein